MCKYIPNTFMLPIDEELVEFFKQMGFVKCDVPLMPEVKPLVPTKHSSVLKFYERWKYSKTKH
jgi:hypothetical protein